MKVGLFALGSSGLIFDSLVHSLTLLKEEEVFTMQEQTYVGLDMGSSRCQRAVIGVDGKLRFSRIVPTSEQHLFRPLVMTARWP